MCPNLAGGCLILKTNCVKEEGSPGNSEVGLRIASSSLLFPRFSPAFLESWDGTVDFAVFHKMVLGVRSTRIDADVTGDFQFMRWMHLCVTFEVGGQSADPTSEVAVNTTIYVDGRAAVIGESDTAELLPLSLSLSLCLSPERLVVNSSSYVGLAPGGSLVVGTNGFSGEIAQVGLWDRVLSEGDVDDLATCRIRDIQAGAFTPFFNVRPPPTLFFLPLGERGVMVQGRLRGRGRGLPGPGAVLALRPGPLAEDVRRGAPVLLQRDGEDVPQLRGEPPEGPGPGRPGRGHRADQGVASSFFCNVAFLFFL